MGLVTLGNPSKVTPICLILGEIEKNILGQAKKYRHTDGIQMKHLNNIYILVYFKLNRHTVKTSLINTKKFVVD